MVAAPLIMSSMVSVASAADDGFNIFNDAKFSGEIRPRYESADVADNNHDAGNAITARTRLAISAGLFEVDGLNAKVGITSVNNFGYTDYSDGLIAGAPNNPQYDLILDPQQAMISEAYLAYTAADTTVLVGRSHVNLDDQRFIGTVGWRQMERAYDTATVINKSVEGLTLLGSWVYGYAGVGSVTTADTGSALVNVNYKVNDALVVTGFGYLLADIHNTYGVRLTGEMALDSVKLNYAASYAMQSDPSLEYNPAATTPKIDASYYDVAIGANVSGVILGAQYESLGAAANDTDAKGFTTPLATLFKFNGFADVFLGRTSSSNNNGLQDASLTLGYNANELGKLVGMYHSFSAEKGTDTNLGSEFDVKYTNKISAVNGLTGLLQGAFYTAGDQGIGADKDVTKFWAMLDYKF